MLLWLQDTEAVRVYAEGRRNNPHWGDVDEITAVMTLADGSMATLLQSLNVHLGAWDEVLIGTEGSLHVQSQRLELARYGEEAQIIETPPEPGSGMEAQMREFLAAVREDREPEASGRRVRATMALLEAVHRSMTEERVVELAELGAAG
jgi:predicted dehydrogenase